MHEPSGGEIRGYELREDGRAHLRYPASPIEWPEVDAAVSRVLGWEVVTVHAAAPVPSNTIAR